MGWDGGGLRSNRPLWSVGRSVGQSVGPLNRRIDVKNQEKRIKLFDMIRIREKVEINVRNERERERETERYIDREDKRVKEVLEVIERKGEAEGENSYEKREDRGREEREGQTRSRSKQ